MRLFHVINGAGGDGENRLFPRLVAVDPPTPTPDLRWVNTQIGSNCHMLTPSGLHQPASFHFSVIVSDTKKVCHFFISAAAVCFLEERPIAVGDSPLTAFH